MAEAAFWGFVGSAALIVGALVARWVSPRAIPFVMAFGAGVLVSAVAFDLTEEALHLGGADATAIGLVAGSVAYILGDRLINPRRNRRDMEEADPQGIVLGAVLDGIPESAAIGLTLLEGGAVSTSFVVAVFLSNLPESISSSQTLLGRKGMAWTLRLWTGVAIVCAAAAAIGYGALDGASANLHAGLQAFAAGAILTVLADNMFPVAFERSGRNLYVGLVTVLGFCLAAAMSIG